MKLLSVTILSFIIFIMSFQNSLIWVEYALNRDFYEMHCENKDKPELECHGKCQVKKDAEKSNSITDIVKVNFNFNLYKTKSTFFLIPNYLQKKITAKIVINNNLNILNGYVSIFPHPTQV